MTRRRLVLVAAALGAIALLTRLPFVTHVLWQWDSVLYARALEEGFHVDALVANARPHPPGYLFYVALAALFRTVTGDSDLALVAVSALGTAVATAGVFLLASRYAGVGLASFVALGFAFDPLVWLNGEVAYPYTVLAAVAVTLALAFLWARGGAPRARLLASLLFGIATGFRQDLLLLLFPLWLWSIWPGSWRERALALGALGLGCLVWFVPSALLSGGFGPYLASVASQAVGLGAEPRFASRLDASSYYARTIVYALAWGLLGFGVLLAGFGVARLLPRARGRPAVRIDDGAFFALWIVPPLLFYVTVLITDLAYVLSVLPAFYVLAAALLAPLVRDIGARARRVAALAGGVMLVATALAFFLPGGRLTAQALASHDDETRAKVAYVRATFFPDGTIILARQDYLQVRYYLTEYRTWYVDTENVVVGAELHRETATRPTSVVIFTDDLPFGAPGLTTARFVGVTGTWSLRYYVVDPGGVIEFTGRDFGVRGAP